MSHTDGKIREAIAEAVSATQEAQDTLVRIEGETNPTYNLLVEALDSLKVATELLAGPKPPHEKLGMVDRVEYGKDKKGEFRFRAIAKNNEPVAQSEGYKNQSDMLQTAGELFPGVEMREVKKF